MSKHAWAVFVAVWHHLWGKTDAWPTQARLRVATGFCERTVRTATRELEAALLLTTRRVRRSSPLGGFRLHYGPGPELEAALQRLALAQEMKRAMEQEGFEALAKPRAKRLSHAPGAPGTACRAHPAPDADKRSSPILLNQRVPCSSGTGEASQVGEDTAAEQGTVFNGIGEDEDESGGYPPPEFVFKPEDAETAVKVLERWHGRRWPGVDVPRSWPRVDVELVAQRLANLKGTPEKKLDDADAAIFNAAVIAKKWPNVRYIFGCADHFLTHVEEGHIKREQVKAELEESRQRDAARAEYEEAGRLAKERASEGVASTSTTEGARGRVEALAGPTATDDEKKPPPAAYELPAPDTTTIHSLGDAEAGRLLVNLRLAAKKPTTFPESFRRHLLRSAAMLLLNGSFLDHADEALELRRIVDDSMPRIKVTRVPPNRGGPTDRER